MSALLIGTFAPDFEFFLRLSADNVFSHTLFGSVVQSLPLSPLVLWLLHSCVKAAAIMLLLSGPQRRTGAQISRFSFWWPRKIRAGRKHDVAD